MKAITPGHKYQLESFESNTKQTLQFIEKISYRQAMDRGIIARVAAEGTNIDTELVTVNDGTTNEEVLKMLLDRMNFLQSKFPCRENAIAITHIETALLWLNRRTDNRKSRGVEGKHVA